MKHTFHIATGQYEFIESEIDTPMNAEEVVAAYHELKNASVGGEGIPTKEMAAILHEYCTTGKVAAGGNTYENLSLEQKLLVKEVQRLIRATNK